MAPSLPPFVPHLQESLLDSIREALQEQEATVVQAAMGAGVSEGVHQAAVASGFSYDVASGIYYNGTNGLYFDPKTNLYWPAAGGETYYFYDSASNQFVPYSNGTHDGGDEGEDPNQERKARTTDGRTDGDDVDEDDDDQG